MDHHLKPLGERVPVFEVPISFLCGESRCKACRLFYEDPDAFIAMSSGLIKGERLDDIVAELQERGHDIRRQTLSRHKTKHLKPAVFQLAQETGRYEALFSQLLGIPSGDLATGIAKIPTVAIIEALHSIDQKKLKKLAKDDPVALIEFAAKHAKALASIQASDRQSQLNAARLQLEKMRVEQTTGALLHRALSVMREELEGTPDGKRVLKAIEGLINSPSP